jgi:hypothetical protein
MKTLSLAVFELFACFATFRCLLRFEFLQSRFQVEKVTCIQTVAGAKTNKRKLLLFSRHNKNTFLPLGED